MTPGWQTAAVATVAVGDRVRSPDGSLEVTVTRIEEDFMGRPGLRAFVEDSDARWLKLPMPGDLEVEVLRAG